MSQRVRDFSVKGTDSLWLLSKWGDKQQANKDKAEGVPEANPSPLNPRPHKLHPQTHLGLATTESKPLKVRAYTKKEKNKRQFYCLYTESQSSFFLYLQLDFIYGHQESAVIEVG